MRMCINHDVNSISVILKNKFECKMISKGKNFPRIDLNEEFLKEICVLLHNNISLGQICDYFKLSNEALNRRLSELLNEELIREKDGKFMPNCMVISLEEGRSIYSNLERIALDVVELIKNNLERIKGITYEFRCFRDFDFQELSLFILSDIILDFIQIENVESEFLGTKRTERNGMNYYYSIQEKNRDDKIEALGIYGNMSRNYGNTEFGLYGNERDNINFHTIDRSYIKENFGNIPLVDENDAKSFLLKELIKAYSDEGYRLEDSINHGFNLLGIMDGYKVGIPVLNLSDFYRLVDIANIIKNDYIAIFEKNREDIYASYIHSIYKEEISFNEYFIWWYHLLYSRATEILIKEGVIMKPDRKNFSYIILG